MHFLTTARLPCRFIMPSSSTYGLISRVALSAPVVFAVSVVFGFTATSKETGNPLVYFLLLRRSLARLACASGCFQSNDSLSKHIDAGDISTAYVTLPSRRSSSLILASHASFSQSGVRDVRRSGAFSQYTFT